MVCAGLGGQPGDVDIDRQNLIRAAPDAVVVIEDAAGAAARAIGHHDLGIGCGLKGAQGRHAHARVTAPVYSSTSA